VLNPPENIKPESWHRFFGASANNIAWALAELPAGEVNDRELLNAAHASAWHWQQIGNELQRTRALMLLAQAHAQAGLGTTALAYADEMRAYFLGAASTPDWEVAFTHVVHAYAAWAAHATEQHAHSYAQAVQAVAAIANEEDRNVVERVFRHVPAP
jgi:pyruvate/2-oxoglutarate/acetoin dehydrogenase E1 component